MTRDDGVQDDQNEQRDHEEHHDRRHDEARHPPLRGRCYARGDVRAIVGFLDLVGYHQKYGTGMCWKREIGYCSVTVCVVCVRVCVCTRTESYVQRSFRQIIIMLSANVACCAALSLFEV